MRVKKKRRSTRRVPRIRGRSVDTPPPTVTLTRTFTLPVEWSDAITQAMRILNAPTLRDAIRILRTARQKRESGRPKGTYGIDPVEAVIIAVSAEYLPQRDILRELHEPIADHAYQKLRRRIARGKQLITQGQVPDELRPEHLRALPAEEQGRLCRRALNTLRERN